MPVAALDGNSAWLEIARLAWNLDTWIVQLALPDEVVRWEWKRFRQAFVYAAAQVICSCRQKLILRISAAHRWYTSLVAAHQKPRTSRSAARSNLNSPRVALGSTSSLNSTRVALSAPSAVSSSHSLLSGRPQPTAWCMNWVSSRA
jgi:hypothetical protein